MTVDQLIVALLPFSSTVGTIDADLWLEVNGVRHRIGEVKRIFSFLTSEENGEPSYRPAIPPAEVVIVAE